MEIFFKNNGECLNCPLTVVSPLPWTNSLILPENIVHSGYKPSTTITNHTLFFQNIAFLKYQVAPVKPCVPKIRLASASPIHIRSWAALAVLLWHAQGCAALAGGPGPRSHATRMGHDSQSVDWRAEPPGRPWWFPSSRPLQIKLLRDRGAQVEWRLLFSELTVHWDAAGPKEKENARLLSGRMGK